MIALSGGFDNYPHFPHEENEIQGQNHGQNFLPGEDGAWVGFHIYLFLPLIFHASLCSLIHPLTYSSSLILSHVQTTKCLLIYFARYSTNRQGI